MARHVVVVEHHPVETPGRLGKALARAGVQIDRVRTHAGEVVPRTLEADGLVVLGGPMGVYEADRHPHIADEIALVRGAVAAGRPVLGVCLGAQILAAALGAEVRPGRSKEIGWIGVRLAPDAAADPLWEGVETVFTPLQWHGDVFDLPAGAVRLADSDLTAVQAFRHGRAWGLLFHVEVTEAIVAGMVGAFADEARAAGADPKRILTEAPARLANLDTIAETVVGRWVGLVE